MIELDYNYDSVGNILGINDIVNLREFNMQYDDFLEDLKTQDTV